MHILFRLDLKLSANWNIRLYHYPRFALDIPEYDNTHQSDKRGKAKHSHATFLCLSHLGSAKYDNTATQTLHTNGQEVKIVVHFHM